MATVHIVLGTCVAAAKAGISRIPASRPESAETITSSGTSQQAAAAVPYRTPGVRFWQVTASGGDVWVKFDDDPVAVAGEDWLLLDGQTREWAAQDGDKIAVIDA